ncbi:MAG: ACT domain-containing protein [Chloroflexi bacterium]|nr:ACT domain-containing protein [Chloroflexota bacterium]
MVRLQPTGITAAAGILAQIGEPFSALIVDRHEVTMIMPQELVEDFQPRLRDHEVSPVQYRLITLDVILQPTLVGFLARITQALAAAGVTVMAFAAFNRDHLLVPADQFERAQAALRGLQSGL